MAFNGQNQTPRATPDPGTDHKLPPSGSLNYGAIKEPTALAGTNGVDVLLIVSGDRDRQMNGSESTRIVKNRTYTITGNLTKKTSGNKTETLLGNDTRSTMGNVTRNTLGATNDLYTGVHTIAHQADQLAQHPVNTLQDFQTRLVKCASHIDEYSFYQFHALNAINTIDVNTDFKGIQMAVCGAATEATPYSIYQHLTKIHTAPIEQRFKALESKVGALQPAVFITMLHEVTVTQKIFILGMNQSV